MLNHLKKWIHPDRTEPGQWFIYQVIVFNGYCRTLLYPQQAAKRAVTAAQC